PYNANALAGALKLDYKTVRHHLRVLVDNDIVMASRDQTYGTLYFLTPRLQNHFEDFLEIWQKIQEDERKVNEVRRDGSYLLDSQHGRECDQHRGPVRACRCLRKEVPRDQEPILRWARALCAPLPGTAHLGDAPA